MVMEATRDLCLLDVLEALDGLDDAGLCTIIARAQGLLLDHPVPPDLTPTLAVEVVGREEGRLLATYRALAPLAQRRVLGHMGRLVRAPHRLARRSKLALPAASAHGAAIGRA